MGRPKLPPVEKACEGCGKAFLSPWHRHRRFCGKSCAGKLFKGHNGEANPRYNGGFSETPEGRTIVICRDGSYEFYYRAVMAAHIGRWPDSDELVHHVNEDHTDDRIENLQLVSRAEHARIHGQKRGGLNGGYGR